MKKRGRVRRRCEEAQPEGEGTSGKEVVDEDEEEGTRGTYNNL